MAALGLVAAGPLDDSIKVAPIQKLQAKSVKRPPKDTTYKLRSVGKLKPSEIRTIAAAQGVADFAGIDDFAHFDARTTFIPLKGHVYAQGVVDGEDNQFRLFKKVGSITFHFKAKRRHARYVVDVQIGVLHEPATFEVLVDNSESTTTVAADTKHLVYVFDCEGGDHWLHLNMTDGLIVAVHGIDVSVLQ